MTDRPLPAAQAVDTIVQNFTQAELALAEIAGAVAKFRTAGEQLAAAEATSAAGTTALMAATDASDHLARQLEAVGSALNDAVTALRAVDPDRLWSHLEASERERLADRVAGQARDRTLLRVAAIAAATSAASAVILLLVVLRIVTL